MGTLLSLFYGNTGRTDDPDPVTGLTSRDVYNIQSSWAPLRANPTQTGVLVLVEYFKKYPKYVELFPFRDLPQSEFAENKRFQAHCNSVIYALNSIIDNLKDTGVLVQILTKIGTTHKPRGVDEQAFENLKQTILGILATILKADQLESWKKGLGVATKVMVQGLNES